MAQTTRSWADESASGEDSLREFAHAAGATDLFLFRRIGADRFAHVGGFGRGAGWAGIVEVGLDEEPLLSPLVRGSEVVRRDLPALKHLFGPYYARSIVATRVGDDAFVVFGSQAALLAPLPSRRYSELAALASGTITDVSPAKRLADELELVNAVRNLLSSPAANLSEALNSVVACAAEALSCELGVLYLRAPESVAIVGRGWELDATEAEVRAAMRLISGRRAFPLCIQDATIDQLPSPFTPGDGVISYYLLELVDPAPGVLLLAHTQRPRGFTSLCQTLGLSLVEAAGTVLAAGLARETLHHQIAEAARQARRDPLTGLANRLAWNEAIAAAPGRPGEIASVIQLDFRGLKQSNDRHGHHTGDELLRVLAKILTQTVRESDLVARIGGDEFAILLPGAGNSIRRVVVEQIRTSVASHPPIGEVPLAVAIGSATTAPPDHDLTAAHLQADANLLRDKRRAAGSHHAEAGLD